MDDKKLNDLMDKMKELAEETLQELRNEHPELKDQFDKIDEEWKQSLQDIANDNTKIYCPCLGDIKYEEALKLRFPFKPEHESRLLDIEKFGEGSTDGVTISIDRNKGYCHTKLYNMCWQTNGEPIIIEKAMQRTGPLLVGAIHYADHPEDYPTPEDINEFEESDLEV